jgi:PhzF family phenazine biosynthesis protein
MSVPYYHVDAFTGAMFSGNPAGVCILAGQLPDDTLQSIAAENNLPETAFLIQKDSSFDLRWFSPTVEIDLCGHATLASAHVLFRHLGYREAAIRFQTRSGELTVTREGDLLSLDFPSRPAVACELPADLLVGLGRHPEYIAKARDYLAVYETEKAVRDLRPDMSALLRLDAHAFIATAPGDHSDFVSRFFAPHVGVPEDPVTGSAHCTLIPYWAQRLGKTSLHAFQISTRGGELFCQDRGERVGIAGRAATYSSGFIHLP